MARYAALLSPLRAAMPAAPVSAMAWLMGIVTALYAEPTSILVQVLPDHSSAARYACRNISWFNRPTSILPTMLLSLARIPGLLRLEIATWAAISVISVASGLMTPCSMSDRMSGSILPRIVFRGLAISSSMSVPMDSEVAGISGSTAAWEPTTRLATLVSKMTVSGAPPPNSKSGLNRMPE